jgi:ubiquinone/menaquinone biosynthesis C-methylase UbiE
MTKSQKEIINHYSKHYEEHQRLSSGFGQLEKARVEQILNRFLPKPPAVILDVGGGTGAYAFPLAKKGYAVHLIDLTPAHIEKAKATSKSQPGYPLASMTVGDARKLEMEDKSVDAVLFFGPLYHLTKREDRIKALNEAYRVLKPNGLIFAAVISRFASLLDGIDRGFIMDPDFVKIVKQDLRNGQHRNPKNKPNYFTTSFFHHPKELENELKASKFKVKSMIAIESLVIAKNKFNEIWGNENARNNLLSFIEKIESDSSILGASAHIMAIGQK